MVDHGPHDHGRPWFSMVDHGHPMTMVDRQKTPINKTWFSMVVLP